MALGWPGSDFDAGFGQTGHAFYLERFQGFLALVNMEQDVAALLNVRNGPLSLPIRYTADAAPKVVCNAHLIAPRAGGGGRDDI
jgi:hypothetical protein